MKEFINKLIGRLEEIKTYYAEDFSQGYSCEVDCVEKYEVKKIVNELAEEYINTSTDTSSDTSTTNADRIRSMTDEELAELFTKLAWNSEVQTTPLKYLEWLQSEVEGGADELS